jgi:hypothetical protein
MARAAGPAAGMTVPQVAIIAVAAIGMFVAVMLLVLGMSRRPARPAPGHRLGPRQGGYGGADSPPVPGGLRGVRPPGPAPRDAPEDPRAWR